MCSLLLERYALKIQIADHRAGFDKLLHRADPKAWTGSESTSTKTQQWLTGFEWGFSVRTNLEGKRDRVGPISTSRNVNRPPALSQKKPPSLRAQKL